MVAVTVVMALAHLADIVWLGADEREGSPATVVFVAALSFLLSCYPTGRPVPRWTLAVAGCLTLLFAGAQVAGPDVSARVWWPLPVVPLLLLLTVGGQGYRYWRRSSAAEREAVRWPLLAVLVVVTFFLTVDVVAVAVTGGPVSDPPPVLVGVQEVLFLVPAAGFLAGLLLPPNDLVDRLLAVWVTLVLVGSGLGLLFAGSLAILMTWLEVPWAAVAAAGTAVVASLWVVPAAQRLARRVVFRGREEEHRAVHELARRLQDAVDPVEIPHRAVEAIRAAIGAEAVVLRRSGQVDAWAVAGRPGESVQGGVEHVVRFLGVPVATLTLWPRPAESALAAADLRLLDALAAAAAPALHSARLASAFPELTDRERQVLAGITRGLPNAAIAARLGVSTKTVANYVSIVLTKLGVPDKERAAELARRRSAAAG
ncbi:regulatory protein, luxR family [Quadrisphaera granulorum]|uniref:Regulatory LuxR family protein n=2 Tax=Quadrisphaera granulorum TaxID=317664 RepID=A0A315ZW58_9ACTN|nr:regulatory LuxR family protein [Quadrisphaera granulorum]SZE98079.1 regulatory protein, luxR family [Quadrisphaera granulorum]